MSQHPTQLGKYSIRSVLGRGAMGIVYEGFDPDIERVVAIKVLHDHLRETAEGKDFAKRFVREARAAARCNHPNIVTVFELGRDNGAEFIVMEFIQGEELKYFLGEGHQFTAEEAIHIVSDVLQGLAAAHRMGIVHRDIKPSNIILLDNGSVKLADFGVAHTRDSDLTLAGNMVGTPTYMSPEGLRGHTVDARADIYSVGMVLLEILTGQKPNPQSLYTRPVSAFLDEVFADPESSALDTKLQQVLRTALADDKENRYPDANAFIDALATMQTMDQRSAAARLSDTVVSQRPLIEERQTTPQALQLSEDTLYKLEQGLASYIGPMASVLVRRTTATGTTPGELIETLANEIQNPEERSAFVKRARHCIASECSDITSSGASNSSVSQGPTGGSVAASLDEEYISRLSRALARHLGPIAPLQVKRNAARAPNRDALIEMLAQQIEDAADRQRFVREVSGT